MNKQIFEEIISKISDLNAVSFYLSGLNGGNLGSSSQTRYTTTTWSDGTKEVVRIFEVCDDYVILYGGTIDKNGNEFLRKIFVPYSQIIRIEERW